MSYTKHRNPNKVIILEEAPQVNTIIVYFCLTAVLTRWPAVLPAAGHVQMKVRHALTAILAGIYDETEAILRYAQLLCQLGRHMEHMGHYGISLWYFQHALVMLLGHYKHVYRRLRRKVVKGRYQIVLIDKARRYLFVCYFAKDAIIHGLSSLFVICIFGYSLLYH